jgi:hypothetical protein
MWLGIHIRVVNYLINGINKTSRLNIFSKKMKILSILTFAILLPATATFAQADTINAVNNKLLTGNLKEGKNVYLMYFTDSNFNRLTTGDIWERTTTFITPNNQPRVEFGWKWYHNDTLQRTVTNICDRKTLAPIYQKGVYRNLGTLAYDFKDSFMVPSDTVQNNAAIKRPKVPLTIPVISWELDLETYPLLPIKKVGQIFDISFYDPNEKEPSYHRYEVTGKEELQLNSDTRIKCWLLKIQYKPESWAIFWLSEKSKEVVKMKEYFSGRYWFKVRLY